MVKRYDVGASDHGLIVGASDHGLIVAWSLTRTG
jgi:hypothetical protein